MGRLELEGRWECKRWEPGERRLVNFKSINRDVGLSLVSKGTPGTHRFAFGLFRPLSLLLSQIEIAHHPKDICAASKVCPLICDPRVIKNLLWVR